MSTYQPSLSAALAHEHITDLLRSLGWVHVIARRATPRMA